VLQLKGARGATFSQARQKQKKSSTTPHDSFLDYDKRTLGFRNVFNEKKLPLWSRSQNLVLARVCAAEIC
jgi:hypothetical protein